MPSGRTQSRTGPTPDIGQLIDLRRPTGAIAEPYPRVLAGTNIAALTAQTLRLVLCPLPAGLVVSNITFVAGTTGFTAGATTNNKWFCILDSTYKSWAFTADDGATAWAASAAKTLAIAQTSATAGGALSGAASFTVPTTGIYYVGIMVAPVGAGGVVPTLVGPGGSQGAAHGLAPIYGGNSTTGMTAVAAQNPATTPGGTAGLVPYFYLS